MRKGFDKNRQRLTLPGFTLVPSALVGLTALFGMGRGDPHRYSHLKILDKACRFTSESYTLIIYNFFDMSEEKVVFSSKQYEHIVSLVRSVRVISTAQL